MRDRPVKVLSVCTSDSLGGAARAAHRIHMAVRDLGVESRMLVKNKETDDPTVLAVNAFIPHNVFYRAFDWVRNKCKNKWQHYQWGKYPKKGPYFMSDLRSTDIGGALRKIDYDILHLHWVNLRFLPLDQLPKDKPIVWTLHDSWPFCGVCHVPMECPGYSQECGRCPQLGSNDKRDLSNLTWIKKRDLYRGLDLHIVTPSHWMAGCARRSSLFNGRDIRVIPNSLDSNIFRPGDREDACRQLGLDAGKRHLLFGAMSATTDPNKGFSYLVDALSQLPRNKKEGIDLVILGAHDIVENLIPGISVHNLGVLSTETDMVAAYRASDLTVVPSLSENLSCTIMESLSCGTPVVAFDIGGNADMVEHKVNGYLAREKDCHDLAEGIIWTLSQDKEKLSEAARRKVLEHFTPNVIGEQYKDLYYRIVNTESK